MNEYLIRVSLDYPSLSLTEFRSLVLKYSSSRDRIFPIRRYGKFYYVRTNISEEDIKKIVKESATLKTVYLIVKKFHITHMDESYQSDLLQAAKELVDRYCIKSFRIYNFAKDNIFSEKLVSVLNSNIPLYERNQYTKDILAIFVTDNLLFFTKMIYKDKKDFVHRTPSKRPVFSPSSLHPKLARLLVNLSRLGGDQSKIIVDPFCGVGGVLIEASLLQYENIGIDIERKWIFGAKQNLAWIDSNITYSHLIIGDACNPPLRKVACIVTDPPYGRITSTHGRTATTIYEKFLSSFYKILSKNSTLVFISPSGLKVKSRNDYLYKELEKHIIPVHGSLTRIINIWRRM